MQTKDRAVADTFVSQTLLLRHSDFLLYNYKLIFAT